ARVERAIRARHGVAARPHEARERAHARAADTREVVARSTHCNEGAALGSKRRWPVRDAPGFIPSWYPRRSRYNPASHEAPHAAVAPRAGALHAAPHHTGRRDSHALSGRTHRARHLFFITLLVALRPVDAFN